MSSKQGIHGHAPPPYVMDEMSDAGFIQVEQAAARMGWTIPRLRGWVQEMAITTQEHGLYLFVHWNEIQKVRRLG